MIRPGLAWAVVALAAAAWGAASLAEGPAAAPGSSPSGNAAQAAPESPPARPKKPKKKKGEGAPEKKPEPKSAAPQLSPQERRELEKRAETATALRGPIDDEALVARFEMRMEQLARADKTTPLADLLRQLDRPRCRLQAPAAPEKPLSPEEAFQRARESTLIVGGFAHDDGELLMEYMGAAFALTEATVVTNYHMLQAPDDPQPDQPDCEFLGLMTAAGEVLAVREVLAANKDADVLILRVEGAPLQPLPLGPDAPIGAWVGFVGHPDFRFYTFEQGYVTRHYVRPDFGGAPWMSTSVEIAEGSSGGPAVDRFGRVVGIGAFTETVYSLGLEADAAGNGKRKPGRKALPPELQMVVRSFAPVASIRALLEDAK